jgi:hypothetical protein
MNVPKRRASDFTALAEKLIHLEFSLPEPAPPIAATPVTGSGKEGNTEKPTAIQSETGETHCTK